MPTTLVARPPEAPDTDREVGVDVRDVTRTFARRRGESVAALAAMSLRVAPREVVAVVGPSGCGKSTLLDLVCGLQRPDAGTVRADPAVLMPQRDLLLPWLDALDNAALAPRVRGVGRERARELARPWLERFGLGGFERARADELSGGMRQRVAFVRTLLAGKPVLALDEPFAALDALTRAQMQAWLADALAAAPRTVVLVTHNVEEAVLLGDRVVVMSARPGRPVADLTPRTPRPRRRTDPAVLATREQALDALGAAS